MTVYAIIEVKVTDDSWIPDYAANVHDIVRRHDGRYLSRSANHRIFEGEPTDASLVALLSFPSMEKLEAFLNDPDYAPYGEARRAGSVSHCRAIDDTDAAGTIPYLPGG